MSARNWRNLPYYVSFSQKWASERMGRYYKRRLSKARRKYAKEQLAGRRGKEPVGIERECNYKGW